MEPLILPATRGTPAIHFEPAIGHFEVRGRSVPEDAIEFYRPVTVWLQQYLASMEGEQVINFHLTYFNSTSLKSIFQLLKQVKQACMLGATMRVCWYAEADDDLLVETVTTLSKVLDMPMQLLPLEEGRARAAS